MALDSSQLKSLKNGISSSSRTTKDLVVSSFILVVLFVVVRCFYGAQYVFEIPSDAWYYLGVTQKMSEGLLLYRDIRMHYSPLVFYILWVADEVFNGKSQYDFFLSVIIVSELIAALLVFVISRTITNNFFLALLGMLLSLIFFYQNEGIFIVLEPFVTVFTLAAVVCAIHSRGRLIYIVSSGVLTSLAFLSKQYGLVAILPIAIFLLISADRKSRLKAFVTISSSFIISTTLFLFLLGKINQVSFNEVISSLIGESYPWHWTFLVALLHYILRTSIALPFVLLLLCNSKQWHNRNFLLVVMMFIVSASPLIVRPYLHYCILLSPYAALLLVYMLEYLRIKPSRASSFGFMLVVVSLFPVLAAALFRGSSIAVAKPREDQIMVATEFEQYIPRGQKVVLVGGHEIGYLAGWQPSDLKDVGFSFPDHWTLTQLVDSCRSVDFVVVSRETPSYLVVEKKLREFGTSVSELLVAEGFSMTFKVANKFEIWQKHIAG